MNLRPFQIVSCLVMLCILLSGCYSYEDINLSADKSYFHGTGYISYRLNSTGETISLRSKPYECLQDESYWETYQSTRSYNRYYGQQCGQIVRKGDTDSYPIDHSIKSKIDEQERTAKIYFEFDTFTIFPLPTDSSTIIDSMYLNNLLYTDVHILVPDFASPGILIDTILFHKTQGMLQVHDIYNHTWNLIE